MTPRRLYLTIIIMFVIIIVACAKSDDPVKLLVAHYDDIIRILNDSSLDIKEKKTSIEAYWAMHKPEIDKIQQSLSGGADKLAASSSREEFVKRFDRIIDRLIALKTLLKEQGIEL